MAERNDELLCLGMAAHVEENIAVASSGSAQGALALSGEALVSPFLPAGYSKNNCEAIVARALSAHYPGEQFDRSDRFRLHQYGMHAIENRLLKGTPALCILEAQKSGFFGTMDYANMRDAEVRAPAFLFHGTFVAPEEMGEEIEPRTCFNFQAKDVYREPEPPCSSHSYGSAYFPKIRALLHHEHPDLKDLDVPLVLSKRNNKNGVAITFTFKKVVNRLLERGSVGWVYVSPTRANTFVPVPEYADQQEVRVHAPIRYGYAVQTSIYDLPGELVVLDGADDALWEFSARMKGTDSWEALARELGITNDYLINIVPGLHECRHSKIPNARAGSSYTTEYVQWPFFRG